VHCPAHQLILVSAIAAGTHFERLVVTGGYRRKFFPLPNRAIGNLIAGAHGVTVLRIDGTSLPEGVHNRVAVVADVAVLTRLIRGIDPHQGKRTGCAVDCVTGFTLVGCGVVTAVRTAVTAGSVIVIELTILILELVVGTLKLPISIRLVLVRPAGCTGVTI
jgi:hypothetical protein